MPSVTGWTRLEPRIRNDDMTDALEARVHDPTWLLGRQWQVGEFQGSDSGSPVSALVKATSSRLTRYHAGPLTENVDGEIYNGRMPLETMVERELIRSTDENLRFAAEAGTHFLNLLAEESEPASDALQDAFTEKYVLDPSYLYSGDILNLPQLAARFSDNASDPVSQFIREAVTEETRLLVDKYSSDLPDGPLQKALTDDLNNLIRASFYDEDRFDEVSLPNEADRLIEQLSREELPVHAQTYLNRLLLTTVYPDLIQAEDERDPATIRFLRIVGNRVPDGTRLYSVLRPAIPTDEGGTVELPNELVVPEEHRNAVVDTVRRWLDWYENFFTEPNKGATAWRTEQLEYEFSVAAPVGDGELVLESSEYSGGTLDWNDFTVQPDASLGAFQDANSDGNDPISHSSATVIPTPVEYRGMPAPRFWEFEEQGVRFGDISAEPTDLPHLLLAEFALIYGNNWFVLPFDIPAGTVSQVTSLKVKDTFGIELPSINPIEDTSTAANWQLFTLSSPDETTDHRLFLPPVLTDRFESDPLEEVRFIRDETANMAWGIERTVAGLSGLPVDQAETAYRSVATPDPPVQDTMPKYRLASSVPDNWIPLVAVLGEDDRRGRAIRLRRGGILSTETQEVSTSRGRILESGAEFVINEEAIPRSGIQITRTYQHTRGMDGESYLWIGRQKRTGRGEGSSGLKFDYVEEGTSD